MSSSSRSLNVVVVGASGDLARNKIIPALFSIYTQDFLPGDFGLFGFARSEMTDESFRERITEHLTCRYTPEKSCAEKMDTFLATCSYVRGSYDSPDSFLDLFSCIRDSGRADANTLFYLAIPPSIFVDVVHAIGDAGMVECGEDEPWTRVVIEKPFGRDRATSDDLTRELSEVFAEDQTFRIDHYLGKEVIQNLMVLRFANLIFEPLWHREFVESVHITWQENKGIEGRGGYFDSYGIIRDVVQNHLLQILALVAMEPPAKLDALHIVDEKVRVLRSVPPVALSELVTGQYTAGKLGALDMPGYTEDDSVPDDSLTSTYASAVLHVNNDRWSGVPFHVRAGKGLGESKTEIRIRFREVAGNMFSREQECPEANELVIRVQPDEAIRLRVINKLPGMGTKLHATDLNLHYKSAFDAVIPEAYESLLLDVIRGDRSLFIRHDELAAAWDIFTPVLHKLEQQQVEPLPYPFGSDGPVNDGP